jgi:iron complex transport system permease protein
MIVLITFAVILLCVAFGSVDVNFYDSFKIFLSKIPFISNLIDLTNIKESHITIIWNLRFPRVIGALFAGMILAVGGVVFQTLFRNPLADPYILGISSGAAFGATISTILWKYTTIFSGYGSYFVGFGAALGSLLALGISLSLHGLVNKKGISILLLSGIALNYFFTSIISLLMSLNNDVIESIYFWTLGSFSTTNWIQAGITGLMAIVLLGVSVFNSRDLDIMMMGEDSAYSVGVDVKKIRVILLVLTSIIVSFVISFYGVIGFVGIVVPHIVRMIIGPMSKSLIIFSALFGGIFLTVSDTMSRTFISPSELPIGVITSLIGAPFFFYILIKGRK